MKKYLYPCPNLASSKLISVALRDLLRNGVYD